jgi:hypothetical protein
VLSERTASRLPEHDQCIVDVDQRLPSASDHLAVPSPRASDGIVGQVLLAQVSS